MNEQIEKLAVQAFSFASAADDSDESDANWWNAYNEKFAELIVQECMNLTEGCRDKYLNSAPYKIAKHFGVKLTNKHAAVIEAYKRGEKIQIRDQSVCLTSEKWYTWNPKDGEPKWHEDLEYRVKPEKKKSKTHKEKSVNKITTADCKNFLVECFTKDPNLPVGRVHADDLPRVLADSVVAKMWKREAKINPNKDNDYRDAGDDWGMYYGGTISGTKLKTVRKFYLNPDEYDSAVCYMVLEDLNGNLILGEDFGD